MYDTSGFFEQPNASESRGVLERLCRSETGFSELHRASKNGRFRVYKCLKPEYRGNPLYETLLRKEFEIGYSLSHNHICEFYSFVQLPELGNCIEMEWVDGSTLEELTAKGAVDGPMALKIAGEICNALSYMHSKQVVHRDLKPSNVLVTFNGHNVKLIDFGLSDSDGHADLKQAAGTAFYAAPELLAGQPVDNRADIYSLGRILSTLPVRKSVAKRCCARDPGRRYFYASEVKTALERKSRLWILPLFLLLAAGIFLLLQRRGTNNIPDVQIEVASDSVTPVAVPVDSIPSIPMRADPVSVPRVKSVSDPASAVPADTTVIDELFRQATELFQ
jgi:serine/threonine protein kinase